LRRNLIPHFYDLGNTREILEKVITLANPAREFGLAIFRRENIINTPNMIPRGWLITSNMFIVVGSFPLSCFSSS
jgi:hypothetical protein